MAPQKHLFRFALENIPEVAEDGPLRDTYRRTRALSKELKRADDVLAKCFPLHVVSVDFEERMQEGYSAYARDVIIQIGKDVYVKPRIATFWSNYSPWLPFLPKLYPFASSKLEKAIRRAGYDGRLVPSEAPDGGQIVIGDKFGLISDVYSQKDSLKLAKQAKKPFYRVHSFTSVQNAHIDGDYGVLDEARIIYASQISREIPAEQELDPYEYDQKLFDDCRTLDKLASEKGYELRRYEDRPFVHKKGKRNLEALMAIINGINFLTNNGRLFTKSIHPKETKYLKAKGIEAVEIPLVNTSPGAGLRCVYGEIAF